MPSSSGSAHSSGGTRLGAGYTLQAPIGEGPTGTVWRGAAPDGTPVAIKVLHPQFASDPVITERFTRQFPLLEPLASTRLVPVRDLAIESNESNDAPRLAIVMDLVIGTNLREYLREHGTIRPSLAFELAEQMLQGLSAVHHAGLLHHDLKPENVMIDLQDSQRPNARVTDAGIVHGIGPIVYIALGASPYRAPEQGPERAESAGSDIFAVGAILFEMLTGKPPEPGASPPIIAGLPAGPATAIAALLAPDPDDRPPSATAARSQLVEAADPLIGIPALAPAPGAAQWQESQRPAPLPDLALQAVPAADPVVAEKVPEPAPTQPVAAPAITQPLLPSQGAFGEIQPEQQPAPRDRPVLIGSLVALVIVLIAALLIGKPFGSGGTDATPAAQASAPAVDRPDFARPPPGDLSTPDQTATPDDAATPDETGPTRSPAQLRRLPSNTPAELASSTWASVRDIASAFPNTIPGDPSGTGGDGQTCANVEVASPFSTGKVLCKYPDGQQLTLQSYASKSDRNQRAAQIKAWDTNTRVTGWRVGTGEGQRNGTLVIGSTDDGQPYRWWTYDQADNYALYVRWPGHTTADLTKWWTATAPF